MIYPHEKAKGKRPDPKKRAQAKQTLLELLEKYQVASFDHRLEFII